MDVGELIEKLTEFRSDTPADTRIVVYDIESGDYVELDRVTKTKAYLNKYGYVDIRPTYAEKQIDVIVLNEPTEEDL